ncbi:MAG: hypothetical protein HC893_06500 [Chloroflexaceae bacterium]|nr:hypothetical protein [Chloroflexaceae bacterium]
MPQSNRSYLPHVVRSAPPRPDLVVSAIRLIPDQRTFAATDPVQIELTITNQGTAATASGFWVDLGFNPLEAPRQNLLWQDNCGTVVCQGLTWGVTTTLETGASIVLRSTPDSYAASFTRWEGRLPAGTNNLYVYVDVWNPESATGTVDEGSAGEQNNTTVLTGLTVEGTRTSSAAPPELPPRPATP